MIKLGVLSSAWIISLLGTAAIVETVWLACL